MPFTSVEAHVRRFEGLGLRHRLVRYPGEDHLEFATQDRFDTVVEGLGRPVAKRRPRDIDFTWRPHLSRPALGIGATGAWWLRRVAARDTAAGSLARVKARSHGLAAREHDVVRTGPTPVAEPLPAILTTLGWGLTGRHPRRQRLDLDLANTARLVVDMRRAGLRCGRIRVDTDGPTRLVLRGLPDGPRSWDLLAAEQVLRLPC